MVSFEHDQISPKYSLYVPQLAQEVPDSKVHGANMGPARVLSAPDGPHVGPTNLAIRGIFCEIGAWFTFYGSHCIPVFIIVLYWTVLQRRLFVYQLIEHQWRYMSGDSSCGLNSGFLVQNHYVKYCWFHKTPRLIRIYVIIHQWFYSRKPWILWRHHMSISVDIGVIYGTTNLMPCF